MIRLLNCLLAGALLTAAQTSPDLNAAEKEFQESLTQAVMIGQSTRDGKPGVSDDKYIIDKVEKKSAELWTFFVRVPFQGKVMTMPFPIPVKWAGDTPVISLTEQAIPGMGNYSARVVVYKGHYAGTWSGKTGGGKVFGQIAKQTPENTQPAAPKSTPPPQGSPSPAPQP